MNYKRINYEGCSSDALGKILNDLNGKGFVTKGHFPSSDTVMQDRYTFMRGGDKLSLLYETKSKILVVTAPQAVAEGVAELIGSSGAVSGCKVRETVIEQKDVRSESLSNERSGKSQPDQKKNTNIKNQKPASEQRSRHEQQIKKSGVVSAPTAMERPPIANKPIDKTSPLDFTQKDKPMSERQDKPMSERTNEQPQKQISSGMKNNAPLRREPKPIKKYPHQRNENKISLDEFLSKQSYGSNDNIKDNIKDNGKENGKDNIKDNVKNIGNNSASFEQLENKSGFVNRKAIESKTVFSETVKQNNSAVSEVPKKKDTERNAENNKPKGSSTAIKSNIPSSKTNERTIGKAPQQPSSANKKAETDHLKNNLPSVTRIGESPKSLDKDISTKTAAKTANKPVSKMQEKRNEKIKAEETANLLMGKSEGEGCENFCVKKFSRERLESFLKELKRNKNIKYKQLLPDKYVVTSGVQKVTISLAGDSFHLQGKRSNLFSELQVLATQGIDYKTAVKSHIESSGEEKRASDITRQLKKRLPDAYDYLSEQSKIDLTMTLIDIGNDSITLSDYSMLLVPSFRGLERFIYDLQQAQGIDVKLIGQAYEKSEGNYVLKVGYTRKIPSVIYAEVMAALYTEYSQQRNFYSHSDNTDSSLSKAITDKKIVLGIFNHMMDVINYNSKKLKEIGFAIK